MEKRYENKNCPMCGHIGLKEIRENTVFGGVLVENVSFDYCPNCHERYCDLATAQQLEAIANNPANDTKIIERPAVHVGE